MSNTHTTATLHCLPGWAMQPASWLALQQHFQQHIPSVVIQTHALPWSPVETQDISSVALATQCLNNMADKLAAQLPDASLVAGWSLGGQLVLNIAQRHPHKVSGFVLVASTPKFAQAGDWQNGMPLETLLAFQQALQNNPGALLKRFCTLQAMGTQPDARELGQELLTLADPSLARAIGLQLLQWLDLRPLLTQITQPCLILHGEQDQLMPSAALPDWQKQLQHATVCRLAGCGHAPIISHTIACASHVQAWLEDNAFLSTHSASPA